MGRTEEWQSSHPNPDLGDAGLGRLLLDGSSLTGAIRPSRLIGRPPSPSFIAAAGAVLALVLTLFSAFERVSSRSAEEAAPLWLQLGTHLTIDGTSLVVVVLVVAAARWAIPERLFVASPAFKAIALSFAPYAAAGLLGGVARYELRSWLGVSWEVAYPWELLTNIGAGTLAFTLVGFVASQYYPLIDRLERLHALGLLAGQAAEIARRADFQRRLDQADRTDEVGHLARTVNFLLSAVEGTLKTHHDFVADTSHELRNPLLALRVNLELIPRLADPQEREECVRESIHQTERMSRLVADLLTLARLGAGQIVERRPVELRKLLAEAVREGKKQARGQEISLEAAAEARVLGDADRLRQVLSNLVGNALRHTPPGGTIALRLTTPDEWARIEVADTGEGIPAEHLPYVFERFYQVGKASHDGAGLGLAIVKHLSEAHGGRVTAESEPGQGSRFVVWLPRS